MIFSVLIIFSFEKRNPLRMSQLVSFDRFTHHYPGRSLSRPSSAISLIKLISFLFGSAKMQRLKLSVFQNKLCDKQSPGELSMVIERTRARFEVELDSLLRPNKPKDDLTRDFGHSSASDDSKAVLFKIDKSLNSLRSAPARQSSLFINKV